jgi:hypothetical protein
VFYEEEFFFLSRFKVTFIGFEMCSKTLMTVKKNGGAVAKICPGVVHKIKVRAYSLKQLIDEYTIRMKFLLLRLAAAPCAVHHHPQHQQLHPWPLATPTA